jgi:hypothetical protein
MKVMNLNLMRQYLLILLVKINMVYLGRLILKLKIKYVKKRFMGETFLKMKKIIIDDLL